ncbi:MAG: hypothetical protein RIB58_01935 [Phycisphaerales bacterium]
MGLDGVELVMEIEDHFKVTLPDSECSEVRTVADLAALVISRLPGTSPGCPTARRYFRIRDLTVEATGVPPRSVRPRTDLDQIFPMRQRRKRWNGLRQKDRVVPRLTASTGVDQAFLWGTGLALFAWLMLTAATWGASGASAAIPLALATVFAGGLGISFAYSRFAVCFPVGCATVADLVRMTMPHELPTERGERLAAEQEVLRKVREMTAAQLGMKVDKVQPQSRFVEDLRMD